MISLALALTSLLSLASCASTGPTAVQDTARRIVLAPGESLRLRDFDLTLTFETVVEDSRCPTGADCIREGDAIIRIRINDRATAPAFYRLHTSEAFAREVVHGEVRLRLVALMPHPSAGSIPRPENYRAAFSIGRR